MKMKITEKFGIMNKGDFLLVVSLIIIIIFSSKAYIESTKHILSAEFWLSLFFSTLQVLVTYFVIDRIIQNSKKNEEEEMKYKKYKEYALNENKILIKEIKGFLIQFFILSDGLLIGTSEEKFYRVKEISRSKDFSTEIGKALSQKIFDSKSGNEIYPMIDLLMEMSNNIYPIINSHIMLHKDYMTEDMLKFLYEIKDIIFSDKMMGPLSNYRNLIKYEFSSLSVADEKKTSQAVQVSQEISKSLEINILKLIDKVEKVENENNAF
ncbi:hypothetical protein QJV36_04830 [Listeria marthii]|uniref:hypothetical protein n=1 Tax=Listeria marthii TaxID=529731 RepID=UPI0028803A9D|nr:hypothetical protein [Listeria marthii]MDT0090538.1 hypothetical protein [Listeria marthii]